MFYKKICGIAAGLFLLCGVSSAQQGYGGVNLAFVTYEEEGGSAMYPDNNGNLVDATGTAEDADLTAVYGRIGMQLNEYFAVEARLGIGISDDTSTVVFTDSATGATLGGGDVDIELEHLFGAYIRVGAPVSDAFYPYAIVGVTEWKRELSTSLVTESYSDSDSSFGVGVDFGDADRGGFNIEYMNYYDKDGNTLSGFSIGYVSRF